MMRWFIYIHWRAMERLRKVWGRVIGMRLAQWLDNRHPDWCWAEICTSIGFGYDFAWIWKWDKNHEADTCREDCAERGTCWCGKLTTAEFRAEWERNKNS